MAATAVSATLLIFLALVSAAAGAALAWWAGQRRASAEARAQEAERTAEHAIWDREQARLEAEIARLEGQLQGQAKQLEQTITDRDRERAAANELETNLAPVREALTSLQRRINDSERSATEAQSELKSQVKEMGQRLGEASADVKTEAKRLTQVLSRNEKRGAWGEMQLRQLVESSGMLKHVHFEEQDRTTHDEKILRPDMVINLGGGRRAVVDAKVPLDAFLRADVDADPDERAARHAQAVATHVARLSEKEYWRRYDGPEFVIMFLPAESLLGTALSHRPELLQQAMDRKVILATPTTLLAVLRAVAFSWRQVEAAEQAREIRDAGAELYKRIVRMARVVTALGDAINKVGGSYDQLVGSLETRVLPAGRKMETLAIADEELPAPQPLEVNVRELKAARWGDDSTLAELTELTEITDPQTEADLPPASHAPGRQSA